MKKQVIRLTENDLRNVIKESVKRILKESFWDNFSPDALDDKAYMDDYWDQRSRMMRDEWERKNIAIRKKYPGMSDEWYEAMLDTFYENKKPRRTIKEAHGEPDEKMALIYDGIIEAYKAQEIADDYNMYSEDEAAAEWFKFKGVVEDGNFEMGKMPLRREFIMNIPELDAEMYYDYGADYYFLVKSENKDMHNFEGTLDRLDSLTNPFNESTIREENGGGATSCANVMQTGCGKAPLGTNPEAGQYTVPFGPDKETTDRHPGFSVDGKANSKSDVQRRQIYNPKS